MVRNKLREKRITMGLTQERVSAAVGISRPFYTEIESGKKNCSINMWLKIADFLKIPHSELVSYIKDE